MASPSSRPKSGSSPRLDLYRRLLEHGAVLDEPDEPLIAVAEELRRHGVLAFRTTAFVRCAEPRDRDFPPPVRDCPGRVEVDGALDEDSDEVCCPDCERPVYPHRFGKRHRIALVVELLPGGILAFVAALGGETAPGRQIVPGVLRFEAGLFGVTVIVVDYCQDARFLDRTWAAHQPCLFVAVTPSAFGRILPEAWLLRVTLAELLAGTVFLPDLLARAAAGIRPGTLLNPVVPVYAPFAPPILDTPPPVPSRRFRVSLAADGVRVEDVLVVPARAAALVDVMTVLMQRFARALETGNGSDPMIVHDLADEVAHRRNREVEDVDSVRRTLNRLQTTIADQIRKELGLPIDHDDVVEAVPFSGVGKAYGYRLKPRTVLLMAAPPG